MLSNNPIMPLTTIPRWEKKAACSEADPELFFPESYPPAVRMGMEEQAKRICAQCPVKDECLELSIRNEEQWGVWGGMTSEQRRMLIRRKRREAMRERRRLVTGQWA